MNTNRRTLSSSDNLVFGFYQTAHVVLSRYVMESYIAQQGAEEGNSVSNEYRHPSDNKALNETGTQESLNRNPSVDV